MKLNGKRLYEGIAVSTALYGTETWSKRKRLNVMEMRCQRSMCEVRHMNRVKNEV